jgi:enoyl reductase
MSKTVVFNAYGDADVLEIVDVDPRRPGPGQVRVRVSATGVEPVDSMVRAGELRAMIQTRFPQRIGTDFAGVVDAVGPGVTGFKVGAEVLGWTFLAANAEHVTVVQSQLIVKPASMPWEEAGAFSASAQTAATVLDKLDVREGDTVLIHGAAGGVGTFAVQLAKLRGAVVIGTASERNHDYLRSLGAVPVRYGEGLTDRVRAVAPNGVQAALDTAGTTEALETSLELVANKARVGTIAALQPPVEGKRRPHDAVDVLGVRRLFTEPSADRLAELVDLYTAGALRVVIQRTFPLAAAAAAHRLLETGHGRGKIVLLVIDQGW